MNTLTTPAPGFHAAASTAAEAALDDPKKFRRCYPAARGIGVEAAQCKPRLTIPPPEPGVHAPLDQARAEAAVFQPSAAHARLEATGIPGEQDASIGILRLDLVEVS